MGQPVKVKVWYPVNSTFEDEIEIIIPDGADPKEWIEDHESEIVEKEAHEEIDSNAFDLGYAGAKLIL